MLVGLSFAFWVIILPPFYFIVWTMEGGWKVLLGFSVFFGCLWGYVWLKTEFFDDDPEK